MAYENKERREGKLKKGRKSGCCKQVERDPKTEQKRRKNGKLQETPKKTMQQENQRRERERDGLPNHSSSMASDRGVKEDSGQNRKKNTRAKFTLEVAKAPFGVHLGSGLRRALPEGGCWD